MASALITHISWGRIEVDVDNKKHCFKDCKLWSGNAKEWDWKVTGTHHKPGIQLADIEEFLAQDVDFIVLSRGMQLMLHTCSDTEKLLCEREIEYCIGQTQLVAELYNDLVLKGRNVGGVFHSTC